MFRFVSELLWLAGHLDVWRQASPGWAIPNRLICNWRRASFRAPKRLPLPGKNTACKRKALPSGRTALLTTPGHRRRERSQSPCRAASYFSRSWPAILPPCPLHCCARPASVRTASGEELLQAARDTITPPSSHCHCCCCRAITTQPQRQALASQAATLPVTLLCVASKRVYRIRKEHLQVARGTITPLSHRCHCTAVPPQLLPSLPSRLYMLPGGPARCACCCIIVLECWSRS